MISKVLRLFQGSESNSADTEDQMELLEIRNHIIDTPPHEKTSTTSSQRRLGFKVPTTPTFEHNSLDVTTMETLLESGADTNLSSSKETKTQTAQWRRPKAWQRVVALSCTLSTLVLICNIVVLVWALKKPLGTFDTARLLYQGDCGRTTSIDFYSHIGINVLSTIILAGGNYAGQILVAPTRDAIDKAHSQGRSVHIQATISANI